MTGKDFLSEYRKLKIQIKGKQDQLNELRESLGGLRAIRYDLDKVQTAHSGDPMLDGFVQIEEKSESVARDIMRLTELCDDILTRVGRMNTPALMELLTRRYIDGQSFEQIAADMGYSYKTTLNYHGDALLEFESANEDLKILNSWKNMEISGIAKCYSISVK